MKDSLSIKKRPSLRMRLLKTNLAIILTYFLLCGFLFVIAIGRLVGTYVDHDLDFLLTEVSSNLNQRFLYMEDVVKSVRNSDDLMGFLQDSSSAPSSEFLQEELIRVMNISSSANRGTGSTPLVEKIFLFRENGSFVSNSYYTLLYSEVPTTEQKFISLWNTYRRTDKRKNRFGGICYSQKDMLYMAYSVLDENMEEQGVIIFELNSNAIRDVMGDLQNYEDSIWMLYNQDGIISGDFTADAEAQLSELRVTQPSKPYIGKIAEHSYRIYTDKLCMQMQLTMGIPQNQASFILYNSLSIYIIGFIIILLAGLTSFLLFTYRITKPLQEITGKMHEVKEGDFETKLPEYDSQEFHEISHVFNEMTEYIHHLIKQVYEKQLSVTEMELKFIQSQMNPHFMFNVLNAIGLQARLDGNEEVSNLMSTFSKLIQAKIYRSDTEKVPISQELEYAEYYLQIQKFRYGEKLSYTIETEDESILNYSIPKLCIQLIAENAVVHGLEPKMKAGHVYINLSYSATGIQIDVIDDGVGFDEDGYITLPLKLDSQDTNHNHVGLNNVHSIIQLLYGKTYGIKIYSVKNKGTTVSIHIPLDQ